MLMVWLMIFRRAEYKALKMRGAPATVSMRGAMPASWEADDMEIHRSTQPKDTDNTENRQSIEGDVFAAHLLEHVESKMETEMEAVANNKVKLQRIRMEDNLTEAFEVLGLRATLAAVQALAEP